jgi:hypothetical protein
MIVEKNSIGMGKVISREQMVIASKQIGAQEAWKERLAQGGCAENLANGRVEATA